MLRRLWVLSVSFWLAACASAPAEPSPTPTLRPMPSRPVAALSPAPPATPVIIASPTPSPTPVTHLVQRGETLIGIAVQYGLSLEALQQANPGVSARFLSVGALLIIPASDDAAAIRAAGAPTPMPVQFGEPACYPQATGALLCLIAARNPGDVALEAVSARLTLAGADGLPLAEAVALPALDVLMPGKVTPLSARFPPPLVGHAAVGVTALSAYPLAVVADRLGPLAVRVDNVSSNGPNWTARGQVSNPTALAAARVRLSLVLWTEAGAVAGMQQLDFGEPLAAGEARAFTLAAASLAGAAAFRAEVLAEGRP